jgi:hypothetical protein
MTILDFVIIASIVFALGIAGGIALDLLEHAAEKRREKGSQKRRDQS